MAGRATINQKIMRVEKNVLHQAGSANRTIVLRLAMGQIVRGYLLLGLGEMLQLARVEPNAATKAAAIDLQTVDGDNRKRSGTSGATPLRLHAMLVGELLVDVGKKLAFRVGQLFRRLIVANQTPMSPNPRLPLLLVLTPKLLRDIRVCRGDEYQSVYHESDSLLENAKSVSTRRLIIGRLWLSSIASPAVSPLTRVAAMFFRGAHCHFDRFTNNALYGVASRHDIPYNYTYL